MFRDLKISNSHIWEELTKDLSFIYKFLEENCDCLDRAMFFKSDFVGFKSDFKFEELKCFVLGLFIFDYHFPDGFEMDFDNEKESFVTANICPTLMFYYLRGRILGTF
jgi:hypothetical protein